MPLIQSTPFNVIDTSFTLDNISFVQTRSLADPSEAREPRAVAFKPDGTKMYINTLTLSFGRKVKEYDLSTPWDISTSTGLQQFNTVPNLFYGLVFKSDGTSFYIMAHNSTINQYNLTVAWDVTTASLFQTIPKAQTTNQGLDFSPDGTKMYIAGYNPENIIFEFTLSSAWDISTASIGSPRAVFYPGFAPNAVAIGTDGTKMFITDTVDSIYEYTLSTPWDVSTASQVGSYAFSPSHNPIGLFLRDDGAKIYTTSAQTHNVYEWNLT